MIPGKLPYSVKQENDMPAISDIIEFLKAQGSSELLNTEADTFIIHRPTAISECKPGDMIFCGANARDALSMLHKCMCSLMIIDRKIKIDRERLAANGIKALILTNNPRLDFIRVVKEFFVEAHKNTIHTTAVISEKAKIGKNASIGPLCSVGESTIGDDCVLHAGVHIYDNVTIGDNVTIHSGCIIGVDGFGYQRNEEGIMEKFPHIGGVTIENDVEIGANTCIARGTLGNTHICTGARFDNLVHIAHNCYVGKHTVITANAMLAGSVRIEDYTWIAPSVCIRDGIKIGSKATIGLAALVTKDVPDGMTVLGVPARDISEYKILIHNWQSIIRSSKAQATTSAEDQER
jgi:UDP-3-O-[3-hydroxymyristoyl] glucosamine N-acyltransferase